MRRAYRHTSVQALGKLCHVVNGQYRIKPVPPVVVRFGIEQEASIVDELRSVAAQYLETLPADRREVLRRFYFGDFARKVVGVGSVGTEAYIFLLLGGHCGRAAVPPAQGGGGIGAGPVRRAE